MKTVKNSLGGKIAAQILLFLMTAAFLASLFVTALLMDAGAYSGSNLTVQNMNLYYYLRQDAQKAAEYYNALRQGSTEAEPFNPKTSNFSFVILDSDSWEELGEIRAIYASRGVPGSVRVNITWEGGYYIAGMLDPELTAPDKYQDAFRLHQHLFNLKWLVAAAIPVSFVLGIVLFGYLMAAAGYRRDGTLALGASDRIPLDLHLLLVAFPIFWLLYGTLMNSFYNAPVFTIAADVCFLTAAYVLLMWFLMSFARRAKHKGFLRNSLLYRAAAWLKKHGKRIGGVLRHFFRWCRETTRFMLSQLPFLWKAALTACGILALMAIVWFYAGYWGMADFGVLFFTALIVGGTLLLLAKICRELMLLKTAGEDLASGGEMTLDGAKLHSIFREHADNLGKIREGMALAVDARLRSERLKTELITNVSHDIKTPLTSIINYVDLLRREEDAEKQREYVDILDKHSRRLKKLTEDLLEVSKVSTGNVSVTLELLDLRESVNQALGEYTERLAAAELSIVSLLPEYPVLVRADGRHMWRVLDNLLSNACKYSMPASRVYCSLGVVGNDAVLAIKNISKEALNIRPDELMERFVRGDEARSSEGSGLGLSIAQSLAEVQGGSFAVGIDGDLFKTELRFPLAQGQPGVAFIK